MGAYDDILHLPHHRSEKHPPMSMGDRAAQFSSFRALAGYEDAIGETARLTDRRIERSSVWMLSYGNWSAAWPRNPPSLSPISVPMTGRPAARICSISAPFMPLTG